ncbi:hypothetical protein ADUPG1_010318, partial [Aduncisulcus paluster]
ACTFDDSTTSQIISTGTLTDGHSIADDGDAVAAVAGYSYSGAYSRDGCDDDSGKPCDAPPSYLTYDPLSFVFDNLEGRGSKKNTADYISNFIFRSYPVRYGQTVASVSMDANDNFDMIQKCQELVNGDVVESCIDILPGFEWGVFILSVLLALFIILVWLWGAKYKETWQEEYNSRHEK